MPVRFCTPFRETVVPDVMKRLGWVETSQPADCNVYYADVHALTPDADFEYGHLLEKQRVNHFPRHVQLTRKDLLSQNVTRRKRLLEKEGHGNELNFLPQTYKLPQEYGPFSDVFRKIGGVWIMKPCGGAQGKGIFLIDRLNQVIKWRKEIEEKETVDTPRDVYVISKYIDDPYLINRSKFDIRFYVLVLSFTPLRVYLYRGGFCRFSSQDYHLSKDSLKDTTMHLTNVAVQTKHGCEGVSGLKWGLHRLRMYLMTQFGRERTDAVFDRIQQIVIQSLLSVQSEVTQDKHCFEIYGYDVLLDRQLKPWLIEVNASPRLKGDSEDDLKLKFNMVYDALTLVDVENRFQGRLPTTYGGFDAIYDQGSTIQVNPATKSLLGCEIPPESNRFGECKRQGLLSKAVMDQI